MNSLERLLDKVAYWLALRAKRKNLEPAPVPSPTGGEGLPESVQWREVARFERESYKVSGCHPLDGGKTLICCYNNNERGTSRLHVVDANGGRTEIWKGGEETIGQGYFFDGAWYLPVEKKDGHILRVPADGAKAEAYTPQGGQYSTQIVDGHIAVGNRLFAVSNTAAPVAEFPRLAGIVAGLVHVGSEWVACDDERGIQSSKGWFVECLCSDLAVLDGVVYAFLRTGEVRVVGEKGLGRTIGNTLHKARRAWSDGRRIWWTTAPTDGSASHQVWCMTAAGMRNLGEFPGKRENTPTAQLGSLFGGAICVRNGGAIVDVALTDETQNGWVLYRGTPEPPVPEPEPTPEPAPAPEPTPAPTPASSDFTPPARKGSPSWTGTGKWNTYKDLGRANESSSKSVTVECWFKANAWSGGGEAQPAGFCAASKGRVGSHWGLNLTIRPDALVWNATKGEIAATCKVTLKTWHHVRAVATPAAVRLWLDGKELSVPKKTFAGNLIQDSGEPLRLGGYYCPWEQATWFNQSINGEITDWKVEVS